MKGIVLSASILTAAFSSIAGSQTLFSDPGNLESGSGSGRGDSRIYYPNFRFPLERGPAYLNSQVYRPGGSSGGSGGQCASENYSYPWRDNYCETRSWDMKMCPAGKGHQGQDIRPADCTADVHWAVSVADGVIVAVAKYSVTLQTNEGALVRYLHLQMNDLAVTKGQRVKSGERIGKVSNWFGGTPTTIHLHFDIKDTVAIGGKPTKVYMPPYATLVAAYKKLMGIK
jgi:murein DD-endopeptidase MepM/ murein hydrolase activator NlpD